MVGLAGAEEITEEIRRRKLAVWKAKGIISTHGSSDTEIEKGPKVTVMEHTITVGRFIIVNCSIGAH